MAYWICEIDGESKELVVTKGSSRRLVAELVASKGCHLRVWGRAAARLWFSKQPVEPGITKARLRLSDAKSDNVD